MWLDSNMDANVSKRDSSFTWDNNLNTLLADYIQVGEILAVLSAPNCFKMFLLTRKGLRFNFDSLTKLGISKKTFYNALYGLKHAGLIEKFGNAYFHTAFGKVIYQRNIVDLAEFRYHFMQTMKILDAMRQAGVLSEHDVARLLIRLSLLEPWSVPSHDHRDKARLPMPKYNEEVILVVRSFDDMVRSLLSRVEQCEKRIFIATRFLSVQVLNTVLQKAKHGIQAKILLDTPLLTHFFSPQHKTTRNKAIGRLTSNNKYDRVSTNVVSDLWYKSSQIERRTTDIAFSFVILDDRTVGLELVNPCNPSEFLIGILVRSTQLSSAMNRIYQQMWDRASSPPLFRATDQLLSDDQMI
jgi:predicted transcriptional regulator